MANFNYYLRDKQAQTSTPIVLMISYGGHRYKYSTNLRIEPRFWYKKDKKGKLTDETDQRARSGHPERPEFNERLDQIMAVARRAYRTSEMETGSNPSWKHVKGHIDNVLGRNQTTKRFDLVGFVEEYIELSKQRRDHRTGRPISQGTIKKYRVALNHFESHTKATGYKFDFDDIDLDWYHSFVSYSAEALKHSANTIGKNIRVLKTFLHAAEERGYAVNQAFKRPRFKAIVESTDKIYLDKEELAEMYALDLADNPRLERVRDLFIVGAWTGLRFGDLTNLTLDKRKGDEIHTVQVKVSRPLKVVVHPIVDQIWDKYNGNLPINISNDKFNEYIKEVGQMTSSLCKEIRITKNIGGKQVTVKRQKWQELSSHACRRSFATNLHNDGVNSFTIMQATGHTTEKAFLAYIRYTPDDHLKTLKSYFAKLETPLKVVS